MWVKDIPEAFLGLFQRVAQSPLFFFLGVVIPLVWMAAEAFQPNPFDAPRAFYPFLILIITLVGYWIESAMKVQQAKQSVQAQQQMNRMEDMIADAERRDQVIQELIGTLELTVKSFIDVTTAFHAKIAEPPPPAAAS